jgi:putative endonuclease
MSSAAHDRGRRGEALARALLERHGLVLVASNYRTRRGELDLVMREADTLVFVEVRYRKSKAYGSPAESVDARKRGRLVRTALHFLQRHPHASARFDVVAITPSADGERIDWIRDAFPAD